MIIVAFCSLGAGAMQIAGGENSLAYFYETTNYGSMVGFFSNRNHEATLLLCALPFIGVAAVGFGGRKRQVASLILCFSVFLALAIALMAVRSRAGFVLLVPAVLATIVLVWRGGLLGSRRKTTLLFVLAGVCVAAGLVYFLGLQAILDRLTENVADDLRFRFAPLIWAASLDHMPFGAGFGSFDPVFRSIEPVELIKPTYLNHAHNDWLEVWLEAGWPGAAVFLGFVVWFLSNTIRQWRRGQNLLAQAAAISIAIIVLHSTLDYPLRTVAIMSVMAFSCALITPSATWAEQVQRPTAKRTRVRVRTGAKTPAVAP